MKIGIKFSLGAAFALVITAIVGISADYSVTKLVETQHWVSHTQDVLEELSQFMYAATESQTSARGYLITGQDQYHEINKNAIHKGYTTLRRIAELTRGHGQESEIMFLEKTFDKVVEFYSGAMQVYDDKGYEPAADLIRTSKGQNLMNEMRTHIEQMRQLEKSLLNQRIGEATQTATSTHLTIVAGMILFFAFVSLFGYLMTKSITGPVRRFVTASENMEQGRYDAIDILKTNDEFEELAMAFNKLGLMVQHALEKAQSTSAASSQTEIKLADCQKIIETMSAQMDHIMQAPANATQLVLIHEATRCALKELKEALAGTSERASMLESKLQTTIQHQKQLSMGLESASNTLLANNIKTQGLVQELSEFAEVIATIDSLAAEAHLIATAAQLEHAGIDDRRRSSAFENQLAALSERSKKDSVKARQLLSRLEHASRLLVANSDDCASRVSPLSLNVQEVSANLEDVYDSVRLLKQNISATSEPTAIIDHELAGSNGASSAIELRKVISSARQLSAHDSGKVEKPVTVG